jgi:hypothetical protein
MRRAAIALVLIVAVGGCSLFVQGPADDYSPAHDGPPVCNRSFTGTKAADILGVVFGSLVTLIALSEVDERDDDNFAEVVMGTGAIGTGLHLGAMVWGSRQVDRCKQAEATYKSWARNQVPPGPIDQTGPPGSAPTRRW